MVAAAAGNMQQHQTCSSNAGKRHNSTIKGEAAARSGDNRLSANAEQIVATHELQQHQPLWQPRQHAAAGGAAAAKLPQLSFTPLRCMPCLIISKGHGLLGTH